MEQLITIKNVNKQNSVFSSEEMEKRLSKLRSNMESEISMQFYLHLFITSIITTTLFIVRLEDCTDC